MPVEVPLQRRVRRLRLGSEGPSVTEQRHRVATIKAPVFVMLATIFAEAVKWLVLEHWKLLE